MATGDQTLIHSTYLKENVWYLDSLLYVFDCLNDPSLTKLTPSVGDNIYLIQGTSSTTSTSYTFNKYFLWGTLLSITNNGNRILCKANQSGNEYIFVRVKYDGNLRAWYSSSDNQRVYTQTTNPVALEGFYNENGIVYQQYDIVVGGCTGVKISSVTDEKIVLHASDPT